MKVLIVDDNAIFRRMVAGMLKGIHDTFEAENGKMAVAAVKANPDTALILSDFNMPEMNGLEMVTNLRQDEKFSKTPVIFLTSERDSALMEQARNVGVDNWLPKPFKKNDLLAVIAKIFP